MRDRSALNLKYCDEKTMKENSCIILFQLGMDRRTNFLEDGH